MKVCDFSLAKPTSMFDLSLYQSITAFYLSLIVSSFYSLTTDCYTLGTPEAYLGLFNFVFYGMNEFILIYFLYTGSAYRKATSLTDSSLRYVGQFTQSFYETQERTEFLTINLKRVCAPSRAHCCRPRPSSTEVAAAAAGPTASPTFCCRSAAAAGTDTSCALRSSRMPANASPPAPRSP